MSLANRSFFSLLALVGLVVSGLGFATSRLLVPLGVEAGSAGQAIAQWCLLLLTGSPETDELLLIGLLGLLPIALLLGLGSLGSQWWRTRRLIQAQTAACLQRVPRRIARVSKRLGLTDRVDVVRAESAYSFCYGLLRPRICLSTGLVRRLTEAELEAVLLHERYHFNSRDPLKVLLTRALGRACFFLPVVAELGRHYILAKELAADHAVIREQGQEQWLASALYKLLSRPVPIGAGAAVTGLGSPVDARIDQLLGRNAPMRLRFSSPALASSALVLGVIVLVTLSPGLVGAGAHLHAALKGAAGTCLL